MNHIDSAVPRVQIDLEGVIARFADLPTLAPVAIEVIRLVDDERTSIRDITDAIRRDPGLTSRLLRIANSAMYSQTKQVTSLERATTLLGLRMVKLLSLGFSLIGDMKAGPLDMTIVWRRSLATSVLAQRFAELGDVDVEVASEAFAAGLLSHVGKLALANDPAYVASIGQDGLWMTSAEEADSLGFTSDEVTARILLGWGLPELLAEGVRHRSRPEAAGSEPVARLACCLQVADAAATLMLVETDDGRAAALETVMLSAATHLGLTIRQIEELMKSTTTTMDDIAALLDLDAVAKTSVTDIMLSARDHLARLSVDMASALSHEEQRNEELTHHNQQLATEAATDPLTGIPNRRIFDAFLSKQAAGRIRRARDTALGLLIIDLDHFKLVNDELGHDAGDEVIRVTASRIYDGTRKDELCARIGGEEFAIVLPETTVDELPLAAERFRSLIADEPIQTSHGPLTVTASVGGARLLDHGPDASSRLYIAADTALYEAKRNGRNRIAVWRSRSDTSML